MRRKSFNLKLKRILLTNKEGKTETWPILPPPPHSIKEYFAPIIVGLSFRLTLTECHYFLKRFALIEQQIKMSIAQRQKTNRHRDKNKNPNRLKSRH